MKNLFRLFAVAALVAVVLFSAGNAAEAQGRAPRFPNGGAFRQGFAQGRGFARGVNGFGVRGNRVNGFGINRGFGFNPFAVRGLGFRRPVVVNNFGGGFVQPQFIPVPVGVNGFGVQGFNAFGVNPYGVGGFGVNQFGGACGLGF